MEDGMKCVRRKQGMMESSLVDSVLAMSTKKELFDMVLSDALVTDKVDYLVQRWPSNGLTEGDISDILRLLPLSVLMDAYHASSDMEQQMIEEFICLCVQDSEGARDAVLNSILRSSPMPTSAILSILESCAMAELDSSRVHVIMHFCLSLGIWRMPSECMRVLYRVSKSLFEMSHAIALRNSLNEVVDMWLTGDISIEDPIRRQEFGKMVASVATVVFRRIAIVNDRVQPFPVTKWKQFLSDFDMDFKLPKLTGLPVRVNDPQALPFKWKRRLAQ